MIFVHTQNTRFIRTTKNFTIEQHAFILNSFYFALPFELKTFAFSQKNFLLLSTEKLFPPSQIFHYFLSFIFFLFLSTYHETIRVATTERSKCLQATETKKHFVDAQWGEKERSGQRESTAHAQCFLWKFSVNFR